MSIRDQITTLFIASPILRRPGWFRVKIVTHYGRNFGHPSFVPSEQRPRIYKANSPEEAQEKARKVWAKQF